MINKAQVIFDNGKPAFVVLRYQDYLALTGEELASKASDAEFVPFVLSDYIKNPLRVMRIEAGLNQEELADILGVTQGYVSRIESRNFKVAQGLLDRVKAAIAKHNSRKKQARVRHVKFRTHG